MINFNGYIEGFYGRLLDWEDRKLIINSLSRNRMNTYLYAPKEDINHRFNWRAKYSSKWRKSFKKFTDYSKTKKINVIAGIAPGIDFDFKTLKNNFNNHKNSDVNLLLKKAEQLLNDGAKAIALLLDDIKDDFNKNYGDKMSEGYSHGILANILSKELGVNIFFVPRIYADELIFDAPNYLYDLSKVLNKNTRVFCSGKNVVSKTLEKKCKIEELLSNEIIFWDNFYANDYCPRRLFVGPLIGRKGVKNLMINPTGLINTDLLILDIVAKTKDIKKPVNIWLDILEQHDVPYIFNKIKNFFLKPDFGKNPNVKSYKKNDKHLFTLDFLLWSWKGKLSREWYPYLFGLKHDLQLNQSELSSERLVKTQTLPLAQHINKI